jgi:hypothetical protein
MLSRGVIRHAAAEISQTGTRNLIASVRAEDINTAKSVARRLSAVNHWETFPLLVDSRKPLVYVNINVVPRETMMTMNDTCDLIQRSGAEAVLEGLLHHAALAARLVGSLDDAGQTDEISRLSDHVDAVVHGLVELLGCPRTTASCGAPASARLLARAPRALKGGVP